MNMKSFMKEVEREKSKSNSISHIRDKLIVKGYSPEIIDDVLDTKSPVFVSSQVKIILIWIFICAMIIVFFYYGILNF